MYAEHNQVQDVGRIDRVEGEENGGGSTAAAGFEGGGVAAATKGGATEVVNIPLKGFTEAATEYFKGLTDGEIPRGVKQRVTNGSIAFAHNTQGFYDFMVLRGIMKSVEEEKEKQKQKQNLGTYLIALLDMTREASKPDSIITVEGQVKKEQKFWNIINEEGLKCMRKLESEKTASDYNLNKNQRRGKKRKI